MNKTQMSNVDKSYRDAYSDFFRGYLEQLAEDEQGKYDENALPAYAAVTGLARWLFWNRVETAIKFGGELQSKAVMDFGCGGGVTFGALAAAGAHVCACDIEVASLARESAKRFGIEVDVRDSIEDFDSAQKYDLFFALDVLEHIENIDPVIEAMQARAKPGAQLILSGPTENWLYALGRLVVGTDGHYHVHSVYDLERRLAELGLKRGRLCRLYPPVPLFRISSWTLTR